MNRIRSHFKQFGVRNSLRRILKSLLRKINIEFEEYLLCEVELDLIVSQKLDDHFLVKELFLEDFTKNQSSYTDSKLEKIRSRFNDNGYKAYGVFEGNRLIYYCWISLNDIVLPKRSKTEKLKSNEGFLFDAFCDPDYRGFGIHTYMNYHRLTQLKKLNMEKGLVLVLSENIPARKSQASVGMQCSSVIQFRNFFGNESIKRIKKTVSLT